MFVSTKAGRVLTVLLLAALLTFGFALTALAAEIVPTLSNILFLDLNGDPRPDNTFAWWEEFRLSMDWDATAYGNTLQENDFFVATSPRRCACLPRATLR